MRERFIPTDNGKIWSCVYGEGKEGIPLLVVHGGPGFLSMPQTVSDFSDERPVYFYDQLGCGKSDRASRDELYSLETYADELDTIRDELGLSEVILVGFSWGCGLICSYLLNKGLRGVKGLILSGPLLSSPLWENDQRKNMTTLSNSAISAIEKGERDQEYGEEYGEAVNEYYRRFVCNLDPWPDYLISSMEKMNTDVYMRMWGLSEFTVTGSLKHFDLYPRLREIDVPVLLTCGDTDEAHVKTVKDFQDAFANACMAVIPDATHMHHIERPEIYKAAVNWFLRGL